MNRSKDWMDQADLDLKHALHSIENKDFNWACFAAQQAAEKAIKSLYLHLHMEGWGHVIKNLLEEISEDVEIPHNLFIAGKRLDQYYIPTRYPNGFDSGKPADFYTEKDAQEAIQYAKEIIEFCQNKISG